MGLTRVKVAAEGRLGARLKADDRGCTQCVAMAMGGGPDHGAVPTNPPQLLRSWFSLPRMQEKQHTHSETNTHVGVHTTGHKHVCEFELTSGWDHRLGALVSSPVRC